MKHNIVILPGDGIGPEVMTQARRLLQHVGQKFGHEFVLKEYPMGGAALDESGLPLPPETLKACRKADAVLLGAVGGAKWNDVPAAQRPEQGLLQLRKSLELYANIRPVKVYDALLGASPLKEDIARGTDFVVVRELTGGLYFGARGINDAESAAFDNMTYTREEILRCAQVAFDMAARRRKRITLVDKENVLSTSKLWRAVVRDMAAKHPDIEVDYMYVDNAAMQIVRDPRHFDVLLTENMFGDILSDLGSVLGGSIGLLPSASRGDKAPALYEPIHGSAPDIAGQDIANPLATILCVAMMLRMSFDMEEEASAIESAVDAVIGAGMRTKDLDPSSYIGTVAMGDAVLERMN